MTVNGERIDLTDDEYHSLMMTSGRFALDGLSKVGCPVFLINEETGHFHEFFPQWAGSRKLRDHGGDSVWVAVPLRASRQETAASVHDLCKPEPVPPGSLE